MTITMTSSPKYSFKESRSPTRQVQMNFQNLPDNFRNRLEKFSMTHGHIHNSMNVNPLARIAHRLRVEVHMHLNTHKPSGNQAGNILLYKKAGFRMSSHRHGGKSLRHRRGAYSSHVDPDEQD